jgi:hypothetical protein
MATKKKSVKKTAAKRATAKKPKRISARATPAPQARAQAATSGPQPRAMRPTVPASYHFPTGPEGLLEWSWARERLTKCQNYVIVTVRPDGRPHAMGMHGLWWDDAYYFGTSPATRKAKNLTADPRCVLVGEDFEELIIVEGTAATLEWDEVPDGLSEASEKKYGWPMDPRSGGKVYKLAPQVVFAFPLKLITTAVTKWVFD